jgi:hypothetical protein
MARLLTLSLVGIVAAALPLGLVPITLASHAALTIEPADTYQRHGGTAGLRAATDAPGIEVSFEVTSSSNPAAGGQLNVDYAGNGVLRDFACTTAADTSGGYSCGLSYLDLTLADTTDTVRAWIDEDPADGAFATGETFVDVAFSWGADLRLQVTPEASSSRTGTLSTLTASVTDGVGDGVAGIAVDFEIVSGPGDDDVGTAGDTRLSPDLACVTSGGAPGVAASCVVSYTEGANVGGDDLILAWIDLDGSDGTVEADGGRPGRRLGIRARLHRLHRAQLGPARARLRGCAARVGHRIRRLIGERHGERVRPGRQPPGWRRYRCPRAVLLRGRQPE